MIAHSLLLHLLICALYHRWHLQARTILARRVPHEPAESPVLDEDLSPQHRYASLVILGPAEFNHLFDHQINLAGFVLTFLKVHIALMWLFWLLQLMLSILRQMVASATDPDSAAQYSSTIIGAEP